jgi:hypothetical protein
VVRPAGGAARRRGAGAALQTFVRGPDGPSEYFRRGIAGQRQARRANPRTHPNKRTRHETDRRLAAGQWRDLANADSPAESEVLAALQKLHASAAGEAAALGNENSTLTGENTDLKSRLSNLQSTAAALENENGAL